MKRLLLSSLLLLSSSYLTAQELSTIKETTRASILQTDIAPFIQAEDTSQQLQSTNEILATTEAQLDAANSEIQSLIDHCSISACESLLDETRSELSDTDSVLESTRDILSGTDSVLESTKEVLVETQSDIVSLQEELITTESELDTTRIMLSDTDSILESTKDVLVEAQSDISSLQEELITTESELDTTRTQFSDTASILESTEDELSECDSVIDQATDLINDPSISDASSIDALISQLFDYNPTFIDSPLSDTLIERINNGLIPYLQATLAKLGELSPIKQIATGALHTVVLTTNGKVYATGRNNYGQLGIGTSGPEYDTNILTAMVGEGTSGVTAIAAGYAHTVALKDSGALYATGYNNHGQLGIDTSGLGYDTNILTAMVGEGTSGVTAIAAGYYHTVALKDSGALYATGWNIEGQLGIGDVPEEDPNYRSTLTAMIGEGASNVTAITTGYEHTIALKDSGALYATGRNEYGQLGIGVTGGSRDELTAMIDTGTSGVTAIAAGQYHTVALKDSGALYATGRNTNGQLGIGVTGGSRDELTAMIGEGTSGVTAIAAGSYHTVALKDSGALYATGKNEYGQLGIGVRSLDPENPDYSRHTLTAMIGTGTSGVTAIAAGYYHTVALKDSETLYATGQNTNGQLGIGSLADQDELTAMNPQVVVKKAGVTEVGLEYQ